MFAAGNLKKGMTLIEVMVALFILLTVILGNSLLFGYGRGQISLRENYRSAVQLATQKLEQLKADDYNKIQEGETEENLSVGGLSCILSTQIEDSGLYKNVRVAVSWMKAGKQHDVSLVTSIAPK